MRCERRWGELGLRDVLKEDMFDEARAGAAPRARAGGKENAAGGSQHPDPDPDPMQDGDNGGAEGGAESGAAKNRAGKRAAVHKAGSPDKRMRQITSFFNKG